MPVSRWLQPDALLWDGRVVHGPALEVSADGRCVGIGVPPAGAEVERLDRRLLLPGLVNAHSHAFQRLIRGRTQHLAIGRTEDDFWTWREAMYETASRLDPDGVEVASRQCFLEMALAGTTTVGEFHYLHHNPDGRPYEDRLELALRVISAAREVGLRIALLRVGYARPGFRVAPVPRQRRFYDPDPDVFLAAVEALTASVKDDDRVTVGVAPHSVRAVPRSWLEAVAQVRPRVLHMHVAEQPKEVEASVAEYGRRPVELLADLGLLDEHFTAVHAVHVLPSEIALLSRSTVCACPTTERDLGDGILPADAMAEAGVTLAIGSDSQTLLEPFEDLRALESHLRLIRGRRVVLPSTPGEVDSLATRLLGAATTGGARSLGLQVGSLAPGRPADLCAVRLDHPSLAGTREDAVLATTVFGATSAAVSDTWVQGTRVVRDGCHPLQERSGQAFEALSRRMFA